MTSNIRTGIIGYGLSGRVFHAPFIDVVEGYELTKISTANPERMALAKERYPATEIVPGGKEIIEDPNIDLVLVTSPNTDHFRWAKEALLAGKHAVVEKPFTIDVAEADELIDIAKNRTKSLPSTITAASRATPKRSRSCSTAGYWERSSTMNLISIGSASILAPVVHGAKKHYPVRVFSTTWDHT